MNLHGIVAPYVATVNPLEPILLLKSAGYATDAAGKRTPQFHLPTAVVVADLQALSYNDLQQIDGLNIQGYRRALYIDGASYGVIRPQQGGGDLIVRADGTTWLNVHVLEPWADWVKFVVTLQDNSAVANTPPLDFSNLGAITYNVVTVP